MNSPPTSILSATNLLLVRYIFWFRALFAGCLLPLSFAPFHFPGLAILGLALFFATLRQAQTWQKAALSGLVFGVGYMGLGVSWIFVSIHLYGHLNSLVSAFITCLFIVYLALFFTGFAVLFYVLKHPSERWNGPISASFQSLLFGALWCLMEYGRATSFGGFPWLQLGFGQIDTPLGYGLPLVGLYGVGLGACLAATSLVWAIQDKRLKIGWLVIFVSLLLAPKGLKYISWTQSSQPAVSVGVIQANLSMRDQWDERLFWELLEHYQQHIDKLIGKKQLIVLPESAIPIPANYLGDWIHDMHLRAVQNKSALLIGIPQPTSSQGTYYFNTLSSFGLSKGTYLKQHLVPFGEYTPKPFQRLMTWLQIPETSMQPGQANQAPIMVQQHPIAALICYELAYPELLRRQLPRAEWIVSVSDDGWFGHSLAMYQQIQMAQALALQTGRYHVIANKDGLSSIIDAHGQITDTLPAFTSGILEGMILPMQGRTPWVRWGDLPILSFCLLIVLIALFSKWRYPYHSRVF